MQVIGVHLDFPLLRLSFISKRGKESRLLGTLAISLETNDDRNQKTTPQEAIKNFFKGFSGKIASGLLLKDFFLRSIPISKLSSKHIEETIRFQSEATSHFKPEEILSVPFFSVNAPQALLYTVLRERLKTHLLDLASLQIDPDSLSTISNALVHFILWKFPSLQEAFIIDLGSNEISCVFLEKGKLKKSHAVSGGVLSLLQALLEDRKKILLKKEIESAAKQVDLLLLKPILTPNLASLLKATRLTIEQLFYSCTRGVPVPVIFTGFSDTFLHLREYLMDFSLEHPISIEEQHFAVATGLAIEQTSKEPLQLRKEEFFPKKNWVRMGIYSLILCSLSLFLSTGLMIWGQKKKKLLTQEIYYARPETRDKQIDTWIAAIEENSKEFPYILQAPRATVFLDWLSKHPLLQELKAEQDPIDIRSIRYLLESYPKTNAPKEPFLAKVELEFNFQNALNARRFHDALQAGDKKIDTSREISWEVDHDCYRTSFYLNNERPHVP